MIDRLIDSPGQSCRPYDHSFSVVTTDAVYGRLNVNVALNRPTFMSGTYYDHGEYNGVAYGAYPSSRAVDGNKDPLALKINHSCVISHWTVSSWWAVDLGAALYVISVLFTNRAEGFGNV